MGNDLTSWRAAIGNFNCSTRPILLAFTIYINILYIILNVITDIGSCLTKILKCRGPGLLLNLNICLAIISLIMLLMAGDVERNPGPENKIGSFSILHLNIRSIRNKVSYIEDTFYRLRYSMFYRKRIYQTL